MDGRVLRPVKTIQSAVHKMLPAKVKNLKADAIVAMTPER